MFLFAIAAIAVDSTIVFAIIGFRRRKQIAAWWAARQASSKLNPVVLPSADNLSKAP